MNNAVDPRSENSCQFDADGPGRGRTADDAGTLPPLVVDLDGTLTPTDTLVESALTLLRHSPRKFLAALLALRHGRLRLKHAIADEVSLPVDRLPLNEDLVDYLRAQAASGRRIVLATAAHKSIATRFASRLGIFDQVIATDDRNLKGHAKLAAIREQVGERFVYAGDSRADLPIWRASEAAVLVGAGASLARRVRAERPVELEVSRPFQIAHWMRALRLHQWAKNLLIFVPLLTSFAFVDAGAVGWSLLAFLSFSLMASANYIVNDLLDLDSDRRHPRKRLRPFASGALGPSAGLLLSLACGSLALLTALPLGAEFAAIIIFYLFATNAYSLVLKRFILLDVIGLSLLYTLRIFAGGIAIGAQISHWLLFFSTFMFLSLAMIKRCAELIVVEEQGKDAITGRDYRVSDLRVLFPVGIASAVSSIVVFGLYVNALETQSRYASPELLWLCAAGLIYWITRLWIKTSRGEMHDDPLVFAIRDFGSRITVLAIVVVAAVAHTMRII